MEESQPERTIMPTTLNKEDFIYELWGSGPNDSVKRKIATWVTYSKLKEKKVIEVDVGNWSFTLKAYLDSNTQLLEDTISKTISYGLNSLGFYMKEVAGRGDIDVTFWYPKLETGCVKAELVLIAQNFQTGLDSEITVLAKKTLEITSEEKIIDEHPYSSVVFQKSDVQSGYYVLKFYIYDSTANSAEPKSYYTTLVKVSNGSTSKGEETLRTGNYITIFRTASGIAWNTVPYAEKYKIFKYETEGFIDVKNFNAALFTEEPEEIQNTEYVVENTSDEKNLYIAIKAYSEEEESEFSNVILLPAPYKITYELNGGTNSAENPVAYTAKDDTFDFKDATREGYKFAGWYTDDSFADESKVSKIEKGSSGRLTLYAKWEIIEYDIEYVLNDGSNNSENPEKYTVESSFTLKDPVREDYFFGGWYTSSTFEAESQLEKIEKGCTGKLTLYAKWKETYTIIFNANINDATGSMDNLKAACGEDVELPKNLFSYNGKVFMGWTTDKNSENAEYADKQTVASLCPEQGGRVVLYAVWVNELTSSEIVNKIKSLTKSASLLVTGEITQSKIREINSALKNLESKNSEIRVSLDLSRTSGLTYLESASSEPTKSFRGCSNLSAIALPDSLKSIGEGAFYGCSGLKTVYYAGTIEQWLGIQFEWWNSNPCCNGADLYINGEKLTELVVPDSVTSIGQFAFSGCSGLTSVEIGNGVTSIGEYVFYGCSGLTSVEVPDSVMSIGQGAFSECSSLESITIPFVGASADIESKSIEFKYIFDTVPSSLKKVKVTGGKLFNGAFSKCSGLTSVELGNGVTSIGENTFYYCSGLTSVEISDSVTSIGKYAFSGCSGLKTVYYAGTIEQWLGIQFEGVASNPCCNGADLYINGEKLTKLVVPDSVTSIGEYAFSGCSGLTSVEIPDSVTSIGSSAFFKCSGLKTVYYAGTIEQWLGIQFEGVDSNPCCNGADLYINGEKLTGLVVPDSVKSIGEYAFSGCSGLTSVEIPDSVKSIGEYAFSGCSGLTSVEIPGSVTSIGGRAFLYCKNLSTINFAGTKAEWNSITKGSRWKEDVAATVVHCSDGNVSL
ncbi:leucine-rich repeat protein [Treponema ruminis]|uniref:leucine-rich repeat protein n=1 Tax=Treponema ruminis TaxID=744515 RepID=UPI00197ED178|nr:leucine-rich repeat protein [Treponema ruminis]